MAKSHHKAIQHKSTKIVGGTSLGGMVAIQIAKLLGIKKVIFIGSSYIAPQINQRD